METPRFLSAREVGAILGLKKSRVYELAHAGILPTVRLGVRRLLFPASGLDSLESAALARAREVHQQLSDGAFVHEGVDGRAP